MRHWRKWILVVAMLLVAVLLTGCQESPEAKYNRAVGLVSEGKYEDAIRLFEENSVYGDSTTMAMYTKAIMAGENGDYETAFSGFRTLGDFKNSPMMITYYTARQYESQAGEENWNAWLQAAETYDEIRLFQDSADRAAACRRAVYDLAVSKADGGEYMMAISILQTLGEYEDNQQLMRYYTAFHLESEGMFRTASDTFALLGDYRDAAEQATAVLQRGYEKAEALEASGDQEGAHKIFMGIKDYKDSFERANKPYYELGISRREAKNWDGAVIAFEKAGTYSDAAEQILSTRYAEGLAKREAKDWDGAATAFRLAGSYSDASTQISETRYLQAKFLMDSGDYSGALAILVNLKGYSDVDSLLENDENLVAAAREAKRKPFKTVGGIVTFGRYPQTETGTDDTPIEWIVLEYDEANHRALLISKYGLDAKPYNTKMTDVTWETCSLRTWLNNDFLNRVFTAEEQSGILLTDVDNSSSQGYSGWSTSGGNNTQDRIFLLSYAEAKRYFNAELYSVSGSGLNTASRVAPTAHAIKQGAYTSSSDKTADGNAAGWWWLRSPSDIQYGAARVHFDGSLNYTHVNYDSGCVRPAFWINLESDIF